MSDELSQLEERDHAIREDLRRLRCQILELEKEQADIPLKMANLKKQLEWPCFVHAIQSITNAGDQQLSEDEMRCIYLGIDRSEYSEDGKTPIWWDLPGLIDTVLRVKKDYPSRQFLLTKVYVSPSPHCYSVSFKNAEGIGITTRCERVVTRPNNRLPYPPTPSNLT